MDNAPVECNDFLMIYFSDSDLVVNIKWRPHAPEMAIITNDIRII